MPIIWGDVRELQAEGMHFGSHIVTHPDMRSLTPEQLEYELDRSRKCLRNILECQLNHSRIHTGFRKKTEATPGISKAFCATAAITMRYRRSWLRQCQQRSVCDPAPPVNSFDDQALFLTKLEGGYDWSLTSTTQEDGVAQGFYSAAVWCE